MKDTGKTNLNAYLFANLVIVGVLLIGLWNRKPVWDVNLRFPNLLLILVLINTILLFRETILGVGNRPARTRQRRARRRSRNLNELRSILKNAGQIDESLLNKSLVKLREISGCETVALFSLEGNQCRQLSAAGELPPALNGSRMTIKGESLLIKYSGSLGEEEIGKLLPMAKPMHFKSAVTRLELTALPLQGGQSATVICIFSSREGHKAPPVSLASIALFLETLLALIESAKQGGDSRYKDKNTGLLLHDCFTDSFETEVERSERYKQEMSLLTLKITGYNALTDSEKAGVARNAAMALKQSLRRLDLMFCGAGEGEFIAILTETGVKVATVVAQRIQKAFAKHNKKADFINKASIGLVIGAATYPTDATHGAGLLEKSSEACNQAGVSGTGIASYSEIQTD